MEGDRGVILELRPYQTAAVEAVVQSYEEGYRKVIITAPTGSGKTVIISKLCEIFLARAWKILVLADTTELITQNYEDIRDNCCLDAYSIGTEIAEYKAPSTAKVVVGSIQTVVGEHRLPGFKPDVIILDEAHVGGTSIAAIVKRHGVHDGECFLVGCTATPYRGDNKSLYAVDHKGERTQITDKRTGNKHPAKDEECTFQKLVYHYEIEDAIDEGWLVEPRVFQIKTATDISKVKKGTNGDFAQGELAKAIINAKRTIEAINGWKQHGFDHLQTLVYCVTVEHAHHAAELWRDAGYKAVAVDGETDRFTRQRILEEFKKGEIQVLCNVGIYTKGTNLRMATCAVMLRPTQSKTLVVQCIGRVLRPLAGVVDDEPSAEMRKEAIALSMKPNAFVLDVVDISKAHTLVNAGSLLNLPATLDMQGQGLLETKKMLDNFEEVRDRIIGECPVSFQELQTKLIAANMLRDSTARRAPLWSVSPTGSFVFNNTPPGYRAELVSTAPNQYAVRVTHAGETLFEKTGAPLGRVVKTLGGDKEKAIDFDDYINQAIRWSNGKIEDHQKANAKPIPKNLSDNQIRCLKANGHTMEEIDRMKEHYAKHLINVYMATYNKRRGIE
jgi:ATP-dependent helicase IRC3